MLRCMVTDLDEKKIAQYGDYTEKLDDIVFQEKIYHRSPDANETEVLGSLHYIISRASLDARQNQIFSLALLTIVLLLGVTTFTVYGAYHFIITRPLQTIITTIDQIVVGDLSHRVPLLPQREFRNLAEAFNSMTTQLQEKYNTIAEKTRTLEMTVEALEISRNKAEEANKTKSQFLANISHELRTPLNAIIGYGEILIEEMNEMNSEEVLGDLRKITSSGEHLLGLINDVLDISKIEAGEVEFHIEKFKISTLIEDVKTIVEKAVNKKENKLEIIKGEELQVMESDITKVRQIFVNLLGNAAKFTEKGTITLEVEEEEKNGERYYIFSIKDTGIGMSEEQMRKIFKPFTQADSSTTRRFGGFGLGLTITKEFCELLGGDVGVTSEIGVGSVFTVRLPAQSRAGASLQKTG